METTEVPRLKSSVCTARISFAIEPETKERLKKLKAQYQIDVTKWVRWLINENLSELEKNASQEDL